MKHTYVTCICFLKARIDIMEKELDKDAERRKVLSHIYDSVLAMFEFQNRDPKIKEEFQENVETLKSNWERLQRKHCPIIVAGKK